MAMSKARRPKPTRSKLTTLTSASVMTVKGISMSSTRQLTVGMMKLVWRWGTPLNPRSLKGISNSRPRSLHECHSVDKQKTKARMIALVSKALPQSKRSLT